MSQKSITRYACDNCTREVFSSTAPTGWGTISLQGQTQTIFDDADICDSCSMAFVSAMTKRRQIETGRYIEPALVIHNPPHPDNAMHFPVPEPAVAAVADAS